jgi:drug/metabolite transporter (DMT)-like permease
MNRLLLLIPAGCDLINSTLVFTGLNFLSSSVYQIMRGGIILSTAICTRLLLKEHLRPREYWGVLIATVGITLVGINSVLFTSSSSHSTAETLLGIWLILMGLVFNGFFYVFEQKLLRKYHLEPLEMVGYEGLFGLLIYLVLLSFIQFIPCPFSPAGCAFTADSYPRIEYLPTFFAELGSNGLLLGSTIAGMFTIAGFNFAGISATKYINAVSRSIGDVSRTVVVWIVGLIVAATIGKSHPNYKWEELKLTSILIELVGFTILITGNLVNNGLIKLPWVREPDERATLLDEA